VSPQIDIAAKYLPTDDWEDETLPTTQEIVGKTLDIISSNVSVNYRELFDFSIASPARISAFLETQSPMMEFQAIMIQIQGGFIQKTAKTVYSDDSDAILLARALASLLLNGLRNSANLLPALDALRNAVSIKGFNDILTQAANVTDPLSQASLIAIGLLNGSVYIAFLRQVWKRTDWLTKYYRPSAQIASTHTVSFVINVLLPLALRPIDFVLDPKPDLLAEWGSEMIDEFVDTPAFGYRDLEDVRKPDHLVKQLATQLTLGQRSKGLFRKSFIQAVATQPIVTESPVWKDFVAAAKRSATPEQFINEGYQRKVLASWLMFLVMSDQVDQYYYPDASVADPFRARFLVDTTVQLMRSWNQ
jgi:hypothetical protein